MENRPMTMKAEAAEHLSQDWVNDLLTECFRKTNAELEASEWEDPEQKAIFLSHVRGMNQNAVGPRLAYLLHQAFNQVAAHYLSHATLKLYDTAPVLKTVVEHDAQGRIVKMVEERINETEAEALRRAAHAM